MKRSLLFAALCAAGMSAQAATITAMQDPGARPLLERLFENLTTAVDIDNDIRNVDYIGAIGDKVDEPVQAGLFENLVIRGAQSTQLTLARGIVLTSGSATSVPTTNTSSGYSWVAFTGGSNDIENITAGSPASGGRHSGELPSHDQNELSFHLAVPTGVTGISARFVYASEEYPEFAGTSFADGFAFLVGGTNYAILPDGTPVSLMRDDSNIHFMPNGENGAAGAPLIVDLEYDGFTRILDIVAPLRGGTEEEFTIVISDTGDEIYDSAVFLSAFSFITGDNPIPTTQLGVKLSDDDYVEFDDDVAPVPVPASLPLLMSGLGMLLLRRRTRA